MSAFPPCSCGRKNRAWTLNFALEWDERRSRRHSLRTCDAFYRSKLSWCCPVQRLWSLFDYYVDELTLIKLNAISVPSILWASRTICSMNIKSCKFSLKQSHFFSIMPDLSTNFPLINCGHISFTQADFVKEPLPFIPFINNIQVIFSVVHSQYGISLFDMYFIKSAKPLKCGHRGFMLKLILSSII